MPAYIHTYICTVHLYMICVQPIYDTFLQLGLEFHLKPSKEYCVSISFELKLPLKKLKDFPAVIEVVNRLANVFWISFPDRLLLILTVVACHVQDYKDPSLSPLLSYHYSKTQVFKYLFSHRKL